MKNTEKLSEPTTTDESPKVALYLENVSVRTWLAGLALQGLLAYPHLGGETADKLAIRAVACADALLDELEKSS